MKKYIGSWSVSGGSSYGGGYEFSSLRDARKTMREIAKGNTPRGNSGSWYVIYADDPDEVFAQGRV